MSSCYINPTAAIEFALKITDASEAHAFLEAWQVGDWDTIRREWPESIRGREEPSLGAYVTTIEGRVGQVTTIRRTEGKPPEFVVACSYSLGELAP